MMNYQIETYYVHSLWTKINEREQPGSHFPAILGCQLFDAKTGELDDNLTKRAQSARCIYCNKQIAAWGKNATGKKPATRLNPPKALEEANAKHTFPCAEDWFWRTLSRWSINKCRSLAEYEAIAAWVVDLRRQRVDRRRDDGREDLHDPLYVIVKMLERLPSGDPEIIQAIELFIAGAGFRLGGFDPNAIPNVHGASEAFPHVFLPATLGDAAYGIWGMCPCGRIEYRGEDMPIEDRLIGWGGSPSIEAKPGGRDVTLTTHVRHEPARIQAHPTVDVELERAARLDDPHDPIFDSIRIKR